MLLAAAYSVRSEQVPNPSAVSLTADAQLFRFFGSGSARLTMSVKSVVALGSFSCNRLFSPCFGARDVLFTLHCAPTLPLCCAPVPHIPGLAVSRRHSGSVHRDYTLGLQVLATLSTAGGFLKAPNPQTFLQPVQC